MKLLLSLSQKTKFHLNDIENMIIWERDVYVSFLNEETEKRNEKIRNKF